MSRYVLTESFLAVLQVESERAATALARAELQEAQLQERLQNLTAVLSESRSSTGAAQEQATQLQSALCASEHNRLTLQVSGQVLLSYTDNKTLLPILKLLGLEPPKICLR